MKNKKQNDNNLLTISVKKLIRKPTREELLDRFKRAVERMMKALRNFDKN